MSNTDAVFAGSIPAIYDRCLGPLLFQPYARIAADRARELAPRRVLETAAGTGIVTAALADALPEAEIVATDLNQAMLDVLDERVRSDKVKAVAADAQDLPFDNGSFDLVLCQFGTMFYPDRVKAASEARRVLADGGTYLQIVWDSLAANPVSERLEDAVAGLFPDDPPRFLSRTPFGYSDRGLIERDLHAAGFEQIAIDTVQCTSRVNAHEAAFGLCQGSPLRSEIEARDPAALEAATAAAQDALADMDGKEIEMSALFVEATK